MRYLFVVDMIASLLMRTAVKCELITREAFSKRKHSDVVEFSRIDGGMRIRDFKIGKGALVTDDMHVTVHYESHNLHGRMVEDSGATYPSGVSFIAGRPGLVPPVLHRGVIGMHVGGTREIIAPPSAHFPEQIPEILVYQVSVVDAKQLPIGYV